MPKLVPSRTLIDCADQERARAYICFRAELLRQHVPCILNSMQMGDSLRSWSEHMPLFRSQNPMAICRTLAIVCPAELRDS